MVETYIEVMGKYGGEEGFYAAVDDGSVLVASAYRWPVLKGHCVLGFLAKGIPKEVWRE